MKKVLAAVAISLMMVSGALACESNCGPAPTPTRTTTVGGDVAVKILGASSAIGDRAETFNVGQYNLDHSFAVKTPTTVTYGDLKLAGGYAAESAGQGYVFSSGKSFAAGAWQVTAPSGWDTGHH